MRRSKNNSSRISSLMRKAKLVALSSVLASTMVAGSGISAFAETLQDGLLIDSVGGDGESTLVSSDKLEDVNTSELGSIEILLKTSEKESDSKEVKDIEFSLLKVADIVSGEYVLLEDYDTDVDLNTIKNASELESAAEKIAKVADYGDKKKTDANGKLEYTDLEVGVYLVEATDAKGNEKYDEITPLLVAIPTFDEDKGQMSYDITVNPKHSPRKTTEKGKKPSPSTDAQTYAPYYFAGAAGLAVVFIAVNVITSSRKKKKTNK